MSQRDPSSVEARVRGKLLERISSSGRPAGAEALPEDPRERVLAIAAMRFEREGLDAVTLEDVAKQAELSLGTVRASFADRDALFRAVLLYQLAAFEQQSWTWVKQEPSGEDQLWAVADRTFLALSGRPLLLKLLLGFLGGPLSVAERAALRQRLSSGFAAALRRGIEDGHFRPDLDVKRVASLLLDLHAGGHLFMEGGLQQRAAIFQRRAAALDLVVKGLKVRSR